MFSFNNLYEYKQTPFSQFKEFQVYPLSENGLKKYFSRESYNHQYLGKVNDLMLNQLDAEEKERNAKENRMIYRQQEDIIEKPYLTEEINVEKLNIY